MVIHLGTDHAGYKLKEEIKKWLVKSGYEVKDCGAFKLDEKDDYPDFVHLVAGAVSRRPDVDRGIVLGMSGQGEAMVCNRYRGVRAAVYYGPSCAKASADKGLEIIRLSRQHNDANILALGARFLSKKEALAAVELWLKTKFDAKEKRHARRIGKIEKK